MDFFCSWMRKTHVDIDKNFIDNSYLRDEVKEAVHFSFAVVYVEERVSSRAPSPVTTITLNVANFIPPPAKSAATSAKLTIDSATACNCAGGAPSPATSAAPAGLEAPIPTACEEAPGGMGLRGGTPNVAHASTLTLDSQRSPPPRRKRKNMGNTCYRNAVFQALASFHIFLNALERAVNGSYDGCLKAKLKQLIDDHVGDVLEPDDSVIVEGTDFDNPGMHDAPQFFEAVVSSLRVLFRYPGPCIPYPCIVSLYLP